MTRAMALKKARQLLSRAGEPECYFIVIKDGKDEAKLKELPEGSSVFVVRLHRDAIHNRPEDIG